jgi:hypothetical protein
MRSAVLAAALLFPLAAIGSVRPVVAQGTPEARQACTPEVFRLCNEFVPDARKITACLQRNRASLNPDCRRFISGGEPRRHVRRHGRRY